MIDYRAMFDDLLTGDADGQQAGDERAGMSSTPPDADTGITGEPAAEYGRSVEEYGRSDQPSQTRRR